MRVFTRGIIVERAVSCTEQILAWSSPRRSSARGRMITNAMNLAPASTGLATVLVFLLVVHGPMKASGSQAAFPEPSQKLLSNSDSHAHCARSMRESDGFICERDALWEIEKQAARRMAFKQAEPFSLMCRGTFSDRVPYAYGFLNAINWYEMYWEPELSCVKERVGIAGDGGKYVCHTDSLAPGKPCLVYSAGSNNDFSFEDAVHAIWPHCEIHTFDPTLISRGLEVKNQPYVNFHPWGLGGSNDPARMFFTLSEAMRRLGHEGREITIFKVDIEHSEYPAFEAMEREGSFPFQQLLIEVHNPKKNGQLFLTLRNNGFAIFSKETNYFTTQCMEYVFGRVGRAFFEIIDDPLVVRGYQCNASVITAGKAYPGARDQSRPSAAPRPQYDGNSQNKDSRGPSLIELEAELAGKRKRLDDVNDRLTKVPDPSHAAQIRSQIVQLQKDVGNLEQRIVALKSHLRM
ncbi:hypothetical protein FVE85_4172 [Porphyridium purpureum]|uniref:Methyltransferase domain-containing protein n=1 Tax=Porphyridium purpureum TaxID=35688 RepID=A0A5J4YUX3_PORPP|nr:hypothetical protein FVE85_4172 [Porphyridium purpureum]|eukprot:POR6862..scf229_5